MLIFDYVCLGCGNKEEKIVTNAKDYQFCSKCHCEMKQTPARVGAVKGNFYNDKCGNK